MAVAEAVIQRWGTAEGQALRNRLLRAIETRTPVELVKGLSRRDGLWDLRGLAFPANFGWPGVTLTDVTLDGADLPHQVFYACVFERVDFGTARLSGSVDYGSHFSDVRVHNADWRGYGFGLGRGQVARNLRLGESRYRRCQFTRVILSGAMFHNPWFEDCEFRRCAWGHTTNFYGSHWRRVRITGEVFDAQWWGTCKYAPSEPNPMDAVDFSEATLKWPLFVGDCDLRRVQFAQDGKHWLIPRAATALAELQATLAHRGWSAEWQRVADRWIRNFARHATDTTPYVVHVETLVKTAGRNLDRPSATALAAAFLEAVGAEQPPSIEMEPPAPCRLAVGAL